jgi:hypothetical protein
MREPEDKRVPALDEEEYIDPDEYRANQRKAFEEEIEAAIKAEGNRQKPPPMATVADIIRNLRVMGLPYGFGNKPLEKLADYLEGKHRSKRGNASAVDPKADWNNFLAYIKLRENGIDYGTAISEIAGWDENGETLKSERAIEQSIKRARDFYKSSLVMLNESKHPLIQKYLGE